MDHSEYNMSFFKLQNAWPLHIYGSLTACDNGVMRQKSKRLSINTEKSFFSLLLLSSCPWYENNQ